jgi:RimJ/RimL family protein N-acetyltransferase
MTSAPEVVFKPTEVRTRKGRTLLVRVYSFEDFGALVEMYRSFEPKRVAQGLPPPDVPRIAHWLDHLQNNSHALLAFDGNMIVAHAILCPIRKDQVEFTIFVLQDYRGEGLGTLLGKLTLAWALDKGLSNVFLTTELSNYRAIGLFRKLGFSIKSSYGDECEMKLDLPTDSEAQAA